MTHAYSELCLYDAMLVLAEALDVASDLEGVGGGRFLDEFVLSGRAARFGSGNPRYVLGMSGTELVWDVMTAQGYCLPAPHAEVRYGRSAAYWCGWILAYYQWLTAQPFERILEVFPFERLLALYPALHEAGEDKAAEVLDTRMRAATRASRLKRIRRARGLTQRELAERSGVNRRTVEEYESGQKSLSRASAERVLALARVLGCRVEDLID